MNGVVAEPTEEATCAICGGVAGDQFHRYHPHPDARYHPFKSAAVVAQEADGG